MRRYADLNSLMNNLIQALRKKYPDWSDEELEDYIRNVINPLDPSGIEANYTLWIILQLRNNQISLPEDGERVKQLLKYYNLNKGKVPELLKDIYSVDFNELENMVNELKEKGEIREKSLKEQYEEIKEGVKEIYNDGTYRILECTTPEAVVRFGRGSRWCTTDIEKAKEYLEHGPIYRIFKNDEPYASLSYAGIRDVEDYDFDFSKDKNLLNILLDLKDRIFHKKIIDIYVASYIDDEDILVDLSKSEDWWIRANVAGNENTSEDILRELVNDDDLEVRAFLARNPKTPPDVLRQLSNDSDDVVRASVAENPNTPGDILRALSKDSKVSVRVSVAENLNAPSDVLERLVKDPVDSVRKAVLNNTNVPSYILRKFSKDEDVNFRIIVANNPNTPIDVLEQLVEDNDWRVRRYLALNPNVTIEILRRLLNDESKSVRDKAKEQLKKRGIEVESSLIIISRLELDVNDVLKCIKENDQKSCDKVFSQIYAYVRGIVYSKFPKYGEDMVSYIVSRVYRLLKRFYNPAKNPNPVIFINKVISDSIHMFLKDQEHYKKELEVGYIPKYIDSSDIKIVIDEIKNKVDYPEVIDMLLEGYTKKEIEEKTGISFYKIDKMLKQLKPVIKRIIWGIL